MIRCEGIKIIQKSRKEEVTFLFPVWDRWNHNKYLVQITNPVIAIPYNKLWWPSGKDTRLSHRQSGFKSRWDLFEEKFFLYLCFTKNLIPKSRNLYLSTPMDDFSTKNKYIELLELFSLKQCVKIPTRITGTSKTVIDHVITNIENKSELCTRVLEQGVSDGWNTFKSFWLKSETVMSEPLCQKYFCQKLLCQKYYCQEFLSQRKKVKFKKSEPKKSYPIK